MMIQISVGILGYWQDELISVILKMYNLIVTTDWGLDQMATVLQTSNSHVLSWMKDINFDYNFGDLSS